MKEKLNEQFSYIFGLLITDGNLSLASRNRGRVTLEVSIKDKDIIDKLVSFIPGSTKISRSRNTNFKNSYESVSFRNYSKEFREFLINAGFPIKNKTINAGFPSIDFDQFSFWRGVIDGDGSLGFTSNQEPFISLVTKSETLKDQYLSFLKSNFSIEKKLKRNKRDNVYNIVVKNENAVQLGKMLYLDINSDLYINRKHELALQLQQWKRTKKKRFIKQ